MSTHVSQNDHHPATPFDIAAWNEEFIASTRARTEQLARDAEASAQAAEKWRIEAAARAVRYQHVFRGFATVATVSFISLLVSWWVSTTVSQRIATISGAGIAAALFATGWLGSHLYNHIVRIINKRREG